MTPLVQSLAAVGVNQLLIDLVIILSIAGVVSLVFQRLKLAAIPAYLAAGAIIGPNVLGLSDDPESVASISQLAIVLLMFGIGLHLDTSELGGELVSVLVLGVSGCVACTALAFPVVLAFGVAAPAAVLIAAAVSLSSTAAVVRLLQQRRELRHVHGRAAFGALLVQDLFAVVILAAVPVLAAWSRSGGVADVDALANPDDVSSLISKAAVGVGGIALIILIGRTLLPRMLHAAGKDGGTELVLIVGAGAGLGSAAATAALGFSPELGAFLAGFLLAATPSRHELMGQLAPVRDLFIPVFFVSVGLGLDLVAAIELWWVVLIALALIVLGKALIYAVVGWATGLPGGAAARTGTILAQTGEFTLLVIGVGQAASVVTPESAAVVATTVALSLMLTPTLFELSKRAARLVEHIGPPRWVLARSVGERLDDADRDGRTLRAIVAGFGPVGREVASRLERAGFECTIIELNPQTVERQRSLGRRVVYGDVANPAVLHSAGAERADAILLTMPDHEAMLRACRLIRTISPTTFIAVRSAFLSRGMQATALGADLVTVDEIATATVMADEVCAKMEATQAPEPEGSDDPDSATREAS